MAFPERFMDELVARTDMVELVGKYVPLQRRGNIFVARCPFHSEKTPSFNVSPERGLFYCFGCHAGGGAIGFVSRIENLDYPEAVRFLAARAGMEVPEDDGGAPPRIKRERLVDINKRAARWFYGNLSRPEGKIAADYMERRGIKPGFARKFGLGCAPGSWDALIKELSSQGVSQEEMHLAGLVAAGKKSSMYDSFRNRLMFPIFDIRGQVAAFSGRALDDSPAKYKNSPETLLYSKRNTLYGAHLARLSKRSGWILAEGNMDVFMLHQAGFDNAVATCGTALTESQARLIARYTGEVVLCYDSDSAGQAATQKAIATLDGAGLRVRVLRLGDAKDPDEFIVKYGGAAFEALLRGAENHMEYRLFVLAGQHDLKNDLGRVEYMKAAVRMLGFLPGQAEREVYAERVAAAAGVNRQAVLKDVEAARRKNIKKEQKEQKYALLRTPKDSFDRAEELALSLLLRYPELLAECRLTAEDFGQPLLGTLFTALKQGETGNEMNPEVTEVMARLLMDGSLPPGDGTEALADCTERILQKAALRKAAAGGKDELEEKYERLKDKKRYGG